MTDENDEEEEDCENLEEYGKVVYSHSYEWESSRSRPEEFSCKIIQYNDKYYFTLPEGEGIKGPYRTLQQAVQAGELHLVTEESRMIESPVLEDDALQSLLVYSGVLPHTIIVNGRKWHSKAGKKVAPMT
jgi:hypothetical protein